MLESAGHKLLHHQAFGSREANALVSINPKVHRGNKASWAVIQWVAFNDDSLIAKLSASIYSELNKLL